MTAVELAAAFAVAGSVLAVAVPAFVRNVHSSALAEAVDGLKSIAEGATTYARAHDVPHAYPPSQGLTPEAVPRGTRQADPPGAWDTPTWRAIDFRPVEEGVPHAFAFAFDSVNGPTRSTFTATAHADLDGDGVTSTFVVTGHDQAGDDAQHPGAPIIDPGLTVQAELE
jgi:type II secretory pathway pseudopilin PulG